MPKYPHPIAHLVCTLLLCTLLPGSKAAQAPEEKPTLSHILNDQNIALSALYDKCGMTLIRGNNTTHLPPAFSWRDQLKDTLPKIERLRLVTPYTGKKAKARTSLYYITPEKEKKEFTILTSRKPEKGKKKASLPKKESHIIEKDSDQTTVTTFYYYFPENHRHLQNEHSWMARTAEKGKPETRLWINDKRRLQQGNALGAPLKKLQKTLQEWEESYQRNQQEYTALANYERKLQHRIAYLQDDHLQESTFPNPTGQEHDWSLQTMDQMFQHTPENNHNTAYPSSQVETKTTKQPTLHSQNSTYPLTNTFVPDQDEEAIGAILDTETSTLPSDYDMFFQPILQELYTLEPVFVPYKNPLRKHIWNNRNDEFNYQEGYDEATVSAPYKGKEEGWLYMEIPKEKKTNLFLLHHFLEERQDPLSLIVKNLLLTIHQQSMFVFDHYDKLQPQRAKTMSIYCFYLGILEQQGSSPLSLVQGWRKETKSTRYLHNKIKQEINISYLLAPSQQTATAQNWATLIRQVTAHHQPSPPPLTPILEEETPSPPYSNTRTQSWYGSMRNMSIPILIIIIIGNMITRWWVSSKATPKAKRA